MREIAFEGNDTTRPVTMLREMTLRVGERADPARVEASRQAVLDLGLFKSVTVREEPVDGGVRLVFVVRERYYILPTPRLDAKSDGSNSYGAQLRWSNFLGLNHALRATWQSADRGQRNVGRESSWSLGYTAPFVGDRDTGFTLGLGYATRPVTGTLGGYEESFRSVSAGLTRRLAGDGPASQGWSAAAGLTWLRQDTAGAAAPAPYGEAVTPSLGIGWRELHYRVYSEEGGRFGARVESTVAELASDYDLLRLTAGGARYLPVGATPHQTLHLFASAGTLHGGPPATEAFALGGASSLRGYDRNFVEGDAYWLAGVELARPLLRDWLRVVVILEAGNAWPDAGDASLGSVYSSLGIGLRLRLTNFVDFEVEAGWAIPLDGGPGRYFASRV